MDKWTKTLHQDYLHCIANFCRALLNIFAKQFISSNTKRRKRMLNFVWNTWKFWWNETDDEILTVFPQNLWTLKFIFSRSHGKLKFLRLRKQILHKRDLGAVDRRIVKTSEWSLISVSTTSDVHVFFLLLVKIKSRSVPDVFVFRVALIIKQLRPKISSRSKGLLPAKSWFHETWIRQYYMYLH